MIRSLLSARGAARFEFMAGIRDELPILLGVAPFGMIYGALALAAGLPADAAQAMSAIVFAGSAQFIATQLFATGTPGVVIILTTLVVNLRHMLYSASVAPHLRRLGHPWKWLLAYLLTDEAYAVTIVHYQQTTPVAAKHWYFLGAGLTLWSGWQVSTAVGIFLAAQVPASWSLDFSLALTFISVRREPLHGAKDCRLRRARVGVPQLWDPQCGLATHVCSVWRTAPR